MCYTIIHRIVSSLFFFVSLRQLKFYLLLAFSCWWCCCCCFDCIFATKLLSHVGNCCCRSCNCNIIYLCPVFTYPFLIVHRRVKKRGDKKIAFFHNSYTEKNIIDSDFSHIALERQSPSNLGKFLRYLPHECT